VDAWTLAAVAGLAIAALLLVEAVALGRLTGELFVEEVLVPRGLRARIRRWRRCRRAPAQPTRY
jgi:hypothetical protein